jgi:hypothetical protein
MILISLHTFSVIHAGLHGKLAEASDCKLPKGPDNLPPRFSHDLLRCQLVPNMLQTSMQFQRQGSLCTDVYQCINNGCV